jgi:hypothetical protein
MAFDQLRSAALPRAIADVANDFAALLKAELELAKAEVSAKFSAKTRAAMWLTAAAVFGMGGLIFIGHAAAFGLTVAGIALPWAYLIVAGAMILIALIAASIAMGDAREPITPTRTLNQLERDANVAREQLQ